MNLKAIIVDDEKHSLHTLKNLVEEFCTGVDIIATASNIETALQIIQEIQPDLLFLDIELQTGTGFDILEKLDNISFEVIFTTAFEQYAIKAVKFSSLDYLLKPIDIEELQRAIEKAQKVKNKETYLKQLQLLINNLQKQEPNLDKICLSTTEGFEFITIHEIIYCKAEGSYTNFLLRNGDNLLVSKHLKEYENLLQGQHFMRVHNSFLINLKEVKKYMKSDGGYIIMNNNDHVSVSRGKKDDFFSMMRDY